MSTRGVVGFRHKRKDLLAYNHSDSYPSYLGNKVVHDLHDLLLKGREPLVQQVEALTIVTEETPRPDEKERRRLQKYANGNVSTQDEYWYQTLRETQGDIKEILKSRYLLDGNNFILNSLFCEWGYIINLDEETLEVYKGDQKKRKRLGRYKKLLPTDGYYPCALVQVFDWNEITNHLEMVLGLMAALEAKNGP
jgi:hypothetical protein